MSADNLQGSFRIAINSMALPGKLPQGDPRWGMFNDSFVNREVDSLELANRIYGGQAYAAWHNGRRKHENFVAGQHIAVDLETGDERSTIPWLLKQEFVKIYAAILHTTPSHTDTDPRARVIFLLDKPIVDLSGYRSAVEFVYGLFPGADASCIDASRFFYGAKGCWMEYPGNLLPLSHLRTYYRQAQAKQKATAQPTVAGGLRAHREPGQYEPEQLVEWAVQDSGHRGRNNQGFVLAKRLQEQGVSASEAQNYMLRYQQQVETSKFPKYTPGEALQTVRSAYR